MQCFPLLLQIDALLNSVGTMAFVTKTFVLWPWAMLLELSIVFHGMIFAKPLKMHYTMRYGKLTG